MRGMADLLSTLDLNDFLVVRLWRSQTQKCLGEIDFSSELFRDIAPAGNLAPRWREAVFVRKLLDVPENTVVDVDLCKTSSARKAPGEHRLVGSLRAAGVTALSFVPLAATLRIRPAWLCVAATGGARTETLGKTVRDNLSLLRIAGLALHERDAGPPSGSADVRLPKAEIRVLEGLALGQSPAEIAAVNNRSLGTVRNQIRQARERLGARSTTHAVTLALLSGRILPSR